MSAKSIHFGETVTKKRKPELDANGEADSDEVRMVDKIYVVHNLFFNFFNLLNIFSTNSYT